ncbi:MATE family efflux transporter [Vallitalea okinawensis]|uniref:MATE family efflux transporter n=1 Tax=Vallitalea okinawensis TaxID=2078660 RepID=UPI000CFA9308|nr:MATE family efflux transporter [Vallitalea okinawensis]
MTKSMDLTKGHISSELLRLAIPIFATSFIQVAYGFIDTFWIGRLSDEAVAAVGTCGYFLWLGASIALICKVGGNVKISQSIGANETEQAKKYISHSILLNALIAFIYMLILVAFNKSIIGFFNLGDVATEGLAQEYLVIIGASMIFYFFNPVISAIITSFGNSRVPFIMNSIGLVFNILLDPVLIFGFGGLPKLGVVGAALATALSQVLVSTLFIGYIMYNTRKGKLPLFRGLSFTKVKWNITKDILLIGLPAAIQAALFAGFSIIIAKIIALWGTYAIAAQKVGAQIESISWATCEGFSVAVSTFIGQNYGAKKYDRLKKGYMVSIGMVTVIGTVATILLLTLNEEIYNLFVSEPETIAIGINYLIIIAFSQIFMCIEIATMGAFNGISKPGISAIVVISLTALRIPMALALSATSLDINGIWWALTITSILKGIFLLIMFIMYMEKKIKPQLKELKIS